MTHSIALADTKKTDGVGKCSVPVWQYGYPAGFCDKPAYGEQTESYLSRFFVWDKYRRPAFASGLACPDHGGPKQWEPVTFIDGTDGRGNKMYCAVYPNFENLQESPAEFDIDPRKAAQYLILRHPEGVTT